MEQVKKNIYILSDTKVEGAKNLKLIQTNLISLTIDILTFDALIFTSKNGVIHLDNVTQNWKSIPSYAISEKTAQSIQSRGGNLVFTGKKGHGNQFAYELINQLKEKKVAFVGAQDVVSNLVGILKEHQIDCTHIPIYETSCIEHEKKIDLEENAIIIFSSPSTIECFLKTVSWKESFYAIAIGETTAKYFPKNITPIISEETSLKSCVQKALSL